MGTYASKEELKAYIRIKDDVDDLILESALESASRWVELYCGRVFEQTSGSRLYVPRNERVAAVDDFYSTDGLTVEITETGVFQQQLTLDADYIVEPVNPDPGWPYTRLRIVSRLWPISHVGRPTIRVTTTRWGWSPVPEPVKRAVIQLAIEDVQLRTAPFGIAGTDQFGPIRVRDNSRVIAWLAPYRRYPILAA